MKAWYISLNDILFITWQSSWESVMSSACCDYCSLESHTELLAFCTESYQRNGVFEFCEHSHVIYVSG